MNNDVSNVYTIASYPEDTMPVNTDGLSAVWQHANVLNDFRYPWDNGVAPRTTFRALHSSQDLHFLFDVADGHVHVERVSDHKTEVIDSSRVEIFFRADQQMMPYYCLEIDADGRNLDYIAHHYRQFDFTWSWPVHDIAIESRRTPDGYAVAITISKSSLRQLGLLKSSWDTEFIEAGLFRAECTETTNAREHMRWISWISPEAAYPDFHIPSAFGVLVLKP